MFDRPTGAEEPALHPRLYWGNLATVVILSIMLIWFGVYPQGLIGLIREFLR
jgi:hypothetical protein